VVEKLRMLDAFRAQLPGVQEDFAYCRLGDREERVLRACIIGAGNARTLALPINVAQGFLGAVVRIAETAANQKIALVTQQDELRPFLRSVLAGLPQVAVLKASELPADAGSRSLEPLEIREQDGQAFLEALQQPNSIFPPQTDEITA